MSFNSRATGVYNWKQRQFKWRIISVEISFLILFALTSPIYYLNRWHFKRQLKSKPFYSSIIVRLMRKFPLLYELVTAIENFPLFDRVYSILPQFSGDVLHVGCGTGMLNIFIRKWPGVRIINMDPNSDALRWGLRLKRFSEVINASIDKPTPLADDSFDVIVFARCFHHIRNHKKAFSECLRVLRAGGCIYIVDPVVLQDHREGIHVSGYMANSSIDGVIWRFTSQSIGQHIMRCLPKGLELTNIQYMRQLHVSNYNCFVPQQDVLAVITKKGEAR